MALRLGDQAPDFTAQTTEGTDQPLRLPRRRLGDPLLAPEGLHTGLHDRAGRVLGAQGATSTSATPSSSACRSTRSSSHEGWKGDIEETQGTALNFPLIADEDRKVADAYDMIHPNANDTLTVRSVFVIGPDKKVKLTLTYPASTGRNVDEIIRVLDSLAADGELQGGDARQLEGRRRRHHRARRHRRRGQGAVPEGLHRAEALPARHPPAQPLTARARASTRSTVAPPVHASGTFASPAAPVHRLGFGAMRITGPGIWGPPADRDGAIARAAPRRRARRRPHRHRGLLRPDGLRGADLRGAPPLRRRHGRDQGGALAHGARPLARLRASRVPAPAVRAVASAPGRGGDRPVPAAPHRPDGRPPTSSSGCSPPCSTRARSAPSGSRRSRVDELDAARRDRRRSRRCRTTTT